MLPDENISIIPNEVSLSVRYKLISSHPLFSDFPREDMEQLAQMMDEVHCKASDKIVVEGDFVDCIFFIVEGCAEVTQKKKLDASTESDVILATLTEGETIGLDSKSFFSLDGKRTATVIALKDTVLLKLNIKNFFHFIKEHPELDKKLGEVADRILKLDFIKRAYPFCHLNNEIIYSISQEIQQVFLPTNTLLFNQNDVASCCYLIQSGQVEIFLKLADGSEQSLFLLQSPELFGEAALLTSERRNASARTIGETRLLILERSLLVKLVELSSEFSDSVMSFMINRFRPSRAQNVVTHRRTTKNGKEVITLHNTELDAYYRLTEEMWFIWDLLDGFNSIRDLTIAFFKKYKVFAPDMICDLLHSLAELGFAKIPTVTANIANEDGHQTGWGKFVNSIKEITRKEFFFTGTDKWISKIYQNGAWLFFTLPIQIIFMILVISGFCVLIFSYHRINQYIDLVHPSFWIFLLLMILVSVMTTTCHEAAHAFTAKKCGYKVQRIGIGWFILSPIAFVDTSGLWLASQRARIAVDIAGVYSDFILAGCFSLLSQWVASKETAIFLWLLSVFIFYNGFKNLSPIKEYDGYYLISDIVDSCGLRKSSLRWFVKILPKMLSKPSLLKNHSSEFFYSISCMVYLLLYVFLTFNLLKVLFNIFAVKFILGISAVHFSLLFSMTVFTLTIFNMGNEIRRFYKQQNI